ncbi:MAG TPA: triose-phosphate isomerase [Solirubrobacterales bacterium]
MSGRTPLVAANWKMHKTVGETEDFLDRFIGEIGDLEDVEIVICPPYTSLSAAVERCRRSPIRVAAQNMHEAEQGAYTGEVSAGMLLDVGVQGVVLGHSERRQYFNETDEALARKVAVALERGLEPILCVGESEAERDAGETEAVLRRQIEADLDGVAAEDLARVVIAYEPIWAIGTGRTATPEQAEEAIAFIRSQLAGIDAEAAEAVRILYGGSVKPANAAELLGREQIDGALVGGASLDPADFLAICEAAKP